MTAPDDNPETVVVPVRRPDQPFADPETAEVPADAAGHWDVRRWSDRPPV